MLQCQNPKNFTNEIGPYYLVILLHHSMGAQAGAQGRRALSPPLTVSRSRVGWKLEETEKQISESVSISTRSVFIFAVEN